MKNNEDIIHDLRNNIQQVFYFLSLIKSDLTDPDLKLILDECLRRKENTLNTIALIGEKLNA